MLKAATPSAASASSSWSSIAPTWGTCAANQRPTGLVSQPCMQRTPHKRAAVHRLGCATSVAQPMKGFRDFHGSADERLEGSSGHTPENWRCWPLAHGAPSSKQSPGNASWPTSPSPHHPHPPCRRWPPCKRSGHLEFPSIIDLHQGRGSRAEKHAARVRELEAHLVRL